MNWGIINKWTVQKLVFSLLVLICLTLAIWAWKKTPALTNFLPPSDWFGIQSNVFPPVIPVSNPLDPFVNAVQKNSSMEVPSYPSAEETQSECSYAKGKWVGDNTRPLYSGLGCKQWLSFMWDCRSTQRPDFSYENYRWQPRDCKLPKFERSEFLRRMKQKTVAMVGDSLGRQQFQSLLCMVAGGEDDEMEDVGPEYGFEKQRAHKRPDGWVYRFLKTNTTILFYWSATLAELVPINITDPTTNIAMHLDRPATFLKQNLHRFDILVLNTGHHWNKVKFERNHWVMYVNGAPNTEKRYAALENARGFTIHSVVKWIDSQLPQHPRLKVFFRTLSPRHFVNGDWNSGGSCDSTKPLAGGSEVTQDEPGDSVVTDAVKGTKVKILDITALSRLRDEAHVSKYRPLAEPGAYDCLHWCLPGIPDTWNEILAAQV